jgi:hypothetical protein
MLTALLVGVPLFLSSRSAAGMVKSHGRIRSISG